MFDISNLRDFLRSRKVSYLLESCLLERRLLERRLLHCVVSLLGFQRDPRCSREDQRDPNSSQEIPWDPLIYDEQLRQWTCQLTPKDPNFWDEALDSGARTNWC